MRLPSNPENWTGEHAERAIDIAKRLFDRYEQQVDFNDRSATNDLYWDYQIARETAITVARYTNWCFAEASMLP